jgi:PEP-CTERM motif
MRTLTKIALAGAASVAMAAPANAAVIMFTGLTSTGSAFTTTTESGFTVNYIANSSAPGSVTQAAGPAVAFANTGGTIEIIRTGGGTFNAASFDFLCNPGTYFAQGYLSSVLQGFTFGGGTSSFATYALPTNMIDRLTINVSAAPSVNVAALVDNINVTATGVAGPVPEPATWAMMLAGFGLVGSSMRRKQAVRVKFA